jgi:hypothetical protein
MIIGEANIDVVTFQPVGVKQPFESELRSRLFDIMDEWEIQADKHQHPALQKTIREMIDQIDDAMHPAEEN